MSPGRRVLAFLVACGAGSCADRPDVRVAHDLPYGSAPLQRLDVAFRTDLARAPVVLFVHGGAYVGGDKSSDAAIPLFFARAGAVGISIDYRLAPPAPWPDGGRDVDLAVSWARAHAEQYGGDPSRIVVFGYSAGATHVAEYLFDPRARRAPGVPPVAAAVLLSGRYVLADDPIDPNRRRMEEYFGARPADWSNRAPISHVGDAPTVPVLVAVAGRDNPTLAGASTALEHALCRRHPDCPRLLRLDGWTHSNELVPFARPGGGRLTRAVLAFVSAEARR